MGPEAGLPSPYVLKPEWIRIVERPHLGPLIAVLSEARLAAIREANPFCTRVTTRMGDWQFLCGRDPGDDDIAGARLVCLEGVVARDRSLNELATMCRDHFAERDGRSAKWKITDRGEEFIRRCVAEFGWSIQGVEAEGDEPPFSYTVGLHESFRHPELIAFGLDHENAQAILNSIGERIRSGERFAADKSYDDILEDYPVRVREVREAESSRAHVAYALWFYEGRSFGLRRLLWPDKSGRFPDAEDAPEWLRKAQPLLE